MVALGRSSKIEDGDDDNGSVVGPRPRSSSKGRLKGFFARRRASNESRGESSTVSAGSSVFGKEVGVTFNLQANIIHEIEPLCQTPEDKQLHFFAPDELNESKTLGRQLATSDADAKLYLRAYESANRQVRIDRKLGSETMQELVQGISLGFRGLEQQSSHSNARRKEMIQEYVLNVVSKHMEESFGASNTSFSSLQSSSLSLTTTTNNKSGSSSRAAKALRIYSSKLSAGSRHFAGVMAKADRMALIDDEEAALSSSGMSNRRASETGATSSTDRSSTVISLTRSTTIQHRRSSV